MKEDHENHVVMAFLDEVGRFPTSDDELRRWCIRKNTMGQSDDSAADRYRRTREKEGR